MSDDVVENGPVESEAPESVESEEIGSEEIEEEGEEESGESEVQAETEEELADELQEAAENGASEEELKDMIRTFELKVNGRTFTKKLDLSDEDAIKKELQKAYAGQQAMQQKAELEKLFANYVNEWKSDPSKFFDEMGLDFDELAEMRLQQRVEEMKKDPAELEREKMQAELQKMREELKSKEEKEKQLEMERLQQQAAVELDNEISKALDAHKTLSASPRVVKQIADTMLWAIDQGYEDVTVEDVLPTVEKEIKNDISSMLSDLPAEVLQQYLGQQTMEKLRQDRLSKVKKVPKTSKSVKQAKAPEPKQPEKPKKKGSLEEFMRSVHKMR